MLKFVFALNCLFALLYPVAASAWGYQGHKVTGSIADKLLKPNAKEQVRQILGSNLDLRKVAPWADCGRARHFVFQMFRIDDVFERSV
jgi:S1/P1 Nuclease